MSTDAHATDGHASDAPGHAGSAGLHHDTADHGDDHGDDHAHDDHAHGEELLGSIDLLAWGAGALGILIGLGIAAAFALATEAM